MQISGFRQSSFSSLSSPRTTREGNPFEQALNDAGAQAPISASIFSAATPVKSETKGSSDFTSMTPRQFSNAAQKMYDEGKLDLDHLFKMQFAAGGIFKDTPVSASESTTPINYVQHFQDQLRSGRQMYGEYGYHKIEDIVKILTQ